MSKLLLLLGKLMALGLLLTSVAAQGQWHRQQAAVMGTSIKVEIWLDDEAAAVTLMQWVFEEMRRIDRLMSPYKPESELALVNGKAFLAPVRVSPELFRLLQMSIAHGIRSEGRFDITYASVGYQYNYRQSIKPSEKAIATNLPAIDYRSVLLDADTQSVRFRNANTRIDLGGIAKGYAVDLAIEYLIKHHVKHGIVSAGGDSRIIGDRRGRPWMLGVKSPRGEGHAVALPVESLALSTSGDYERFFDVDGERHHHIIDPANGKSVKGVQSVTIMGPTAMQTDVLSTTVFVMGVKKGLAYIEKQPAYSAIIIDDRGKLHYSSDLVRPER